MVKGKYIVIEGPKGVGKTLQTNAVAEALRVAGFPVRIMREPDGQNDLTARAIRHITNDPRYPMNNRTEVLLYNAARSQSLEVIKQATEQGVMCVCDRNYLTTLAVQYYGKDNIPDYDAINTIINFAVNGYQPDLTLVLDADVVTLKERISSTSPDRLYDKIDDTFLEKVRAGYLWEAKQRNLPVIYANLPAEKVFENVWSYITDLLTEEDRNVSKPEAIGEIIAHKTPLTSPPITTTTTGPNNHQKLSQDQSTKSTISEEMLSKNKQGNLVITDAGKSYLSTIITNTEHNVYGFNENISPITVAAAMARLSRRGDDMRITLLDEFIGKVDKDEKLLQRVITAYGDDSVQQLVGQHFVVEGASNLLTKKLEWGRLAAYLEQSTRYIYFDQKNSKGKYKYYTPSSFNKKTKKQYEDALNKIFDIYSEVVHDLTQYIQGKSKTPKDERDGAWRAATRAQACDAARPMLPVATQSTVGIFASGQALESLIMHLMSDQLLEARKTGEQLLIEARKTIPTFLERADIPERGGALMAYRANTYNSVSKLTKKLVRETHSNDNQPVSLVDFWPRNELDIVPDMLYEHSNLSLKELEAIVRTWPYEKKVEVFTSYMGDRLNRRHRPGRALEKIHYSWDLVCDYGIFRDLQRHRMVDDLEWQELNPRFGFDIPQLVEEAGLSDKFEECFDISFKLYSDLQAAKYTTEAQYATLLGHKMRWKVTYNAREAFHLHELRTSPQGHPGYRKLVLEMHAELSNVHPLIADAMKFVNKGEDPELTRLGAERYTQYKLKKIDSKS